MNKYLEHMIKCRNLFGNIRPGKPPRKNKIDLTKKEDILELLETLESDLSPENLTCDGEISPAQALVVRKQIIEAQSYLNNLIKDML